MATDLWNDSEMGAQIMQTQISDVDSIDND